VLFRSKIRSNIIAKIVVIVVAIIVVPTISVGECASYCVRIAITVVGTKVKLEVFKDKNVIIEREAVLDPLNCFISFIAFIPIGVAALPNPKIFAVILDNIYDIAG